MYYFNLYYYLYNIKWLGHSDNSSTYLHLEKHILKFMTRRIKFPIRSCMYADNLNYFWFLLTSHKNPHEVMFGSSTIISICLTQSKSCRLHSCLSCSSKQFISIFQLWACSFLAPSYTQYTHPHEPPALATLTLSCFAFFRSRQTYPSTQR